MHCIVVRKPLCGRVCRYCPGPSVGVSPPASLFLRGLYERHRPFFFLLFFPCLSVRFLPAVPASTAWRPRVSPTTGACSAFVPPAVSVRDNEKGGREAGGNTGPRAAREGGADTSWRDACWALAPRRHLSPREYPAQRCIPLHPASYDDLSWNTGTMFSYRCAPMCLYPASWRRFVGRCSLPQRFLVFRCSRLGPVVLRPVSAEDERVWVSLVPPTTTAAATGTASTTGTAAGTTISALLSCFFAVPFFFPGLLNKWCSSRTLLAGRYPFLHAIWSPPAPPFRPSLSAMRILPKAYIRDWVFPKRLDDFVIRELYCAGLIVLFFFLLYRLVSSVLHDLIRTSLFASLRTVRYLETSDFFAPQPHHTILSPA